MNFVEKQNKQVQNMYMERVEKSGEGAKWQVVFSGLYFT